ncbi:MAG: TIGR01777 family oxidoreductase [Flavobacteriaceae bacterium]|nr:TIGR01777 family oxidoreductase [Flavobacteriaceae bacterium]
MKILISGATGLVGKVIVKQALIEGHQIHFLTTQKAKIHSIKGARGFYWNPNKNEIDVSCFDGIDTLIHLAGATVSKFWTKKHKQEILNSRLLTTQLLIDGLKKTKHQVQNVVSASAIGIYPSSLDKIHTENDAAFPNSFMQKVVLDWEQIVGGFLELDIKVCKLRIGLVLAKDGGVLATLKIPAKLGVGAAFGNGKQWQSWIHIDDLTNLFLRAASDQWEGVYNAVAPEVVSQNQFVKQITKTINRPFFMPPIPEFLLQILVGEMSSLVLNSHHVSSNKALEKEFKYQFPTLQKACENLL